MGAMRPPPAPWLAAALAALCAFSVHVDRRSALAELGSPAWAAPTGKDKAEAKKLAAQGRAALKNKRFDEAETALRRANELDPSPQLKLDLARALSGAGKLVEASTVLHEIEAAPGKGWQDKLVRGSAKKLLGEIEGRIPWIQVTVTGPKPAEASVSIDGNEIDATAEVPIDPGDHVVQVEAPGWVSAEEKVKLGEGVHRQVKIKLEREAAAAPPPPPPDTGGSKVPAIIAFGVGVAGTGVGAVFGILAFQQTSEAKERCDGNVCPDDPRVVNARDAAVQYGNISTIGFIAGGVGVATGIVLLLVSSGSDEPEPTDASARIQPWIGPGQAGVIGRF
jgi:hypothetical protein